MSTALEKAHEARRLAKEAGQTIVRLDPIEKAKKKPKSLRLAVNAKCWDCVGGTSDPGPRGRIRDCTVTRCPLHPVRPYQKGAEDEAEAAGEDEIAHVKNIVQEGLTLYALLSDDRILQSPVFESEEEAQRIISNPLIAVEELFDAGWVEARDV